MKHIFSILLILLSSVLLSVNLSNTESKEQSLYPQPEPRVIIKKVFIPKKIIIKKPVYIDRIVPKEVIRRVVVTKVVPKPVYITKKVYVPKPVYIKKKYFHKYPPYQSLMEKTRKKILGGDPSTWSPFPLEENSG